MSGSRIPELNDRLDAIVATLEGIRPYDSPKELELESKLLKSKAETLKKLADDLRSYSHSGLQIDLLNELQERVQIYLKDKQNDPVLQQYAGILAVGSFVQALTFLEQAVDSLKKERESRKVEGKASIDDQKRQ